MPDSQIPRYARRAREAGHPAVDLLFDHIQSIASHPVVEWQSESDLRPGTAQITLRLPLDDGMGSNRLNVIEKQIDGGVPRFARAPGVARDLGVGHRGAVSLWTWGWVGWG